MNHEDFQVNRKFAVVVISIFVMLLVLPTIAWGILKFTTSEDSVIMEKIDFDTGENRNMASFPDKFDPKTITAELETWYNDHLPFRSVLYRAQNNLEKWVEAPYDQKMRPLLISLFHGQKNNGAPNGAVGERIDVETTKHIPGEVLAEVEPSFESYGYTLVKCIECGGEYRTNIYDKLKDDSYFPPIYRSEDVTEGRNKWLFYRGANSEDYYTGANIRDEERMAKDAAVLVELNELCKEKGITLQYAVYPNKEQVYTENMPSITVLDEYKMVERFVDYVNDNTDVNIVYPLEELVEAKPYWDVYFQYDSHWNAAGGFIGLQAMYENLGFETTDLRDLPVKQLCETDSDYETYVYDEDTNSTYGARGDLIPVAGVDPVDYPGSFNYVIDYRPEVEVLSVKGAVDGFEMTRFTTSNGPIDKKFVMIGDSYRALITPFLERDFTDCVLLHRDNMYDPDTLEAIKDADILVLSTVERYSDWGLITTSKKVMEILSEE